MGRRGEDFIIILDLQAVFSLSDFSAVEKNQEALAGVE
jgi:hypothetical protein